jgi:hypothetical protein
MGEVIATLIIKTAERLIYFFKSLYDEMKHKKDNNDLSNLPIFIQDLTEDEYNDFMTWLIDERRHPNLKLNHKDLYDQLKKYQNIDSIDKHKILMEKWKKSLSNDKLEISD